MRQCLILLTIIFYSLSFIKMGLMENFCQALKSLYKAPVTCVKVSEYLTEWFLSPSGVKQGDVLSPTIFALFIHDSARDVKQLWKGVTCGHVIVNILLYADDIILLSENEEDLQLMLTCRDKWCKKWRLRMNQKKTQIMHFRRPGRERRSFQFYVGEKQLKFTVFLDESMSFLHGATVLADFTSRALEGVIGETKILRDLGYSTFSKP